MLNFSMIELVRQKGRKVDKELKRQLMDFYKPFRSIPCFMQRPFENIRKRMKRLPVIIEFEVGRYTSGLNDVKQTKCRNLREFPSISSCSAQLTLKNMEKLMNSCDHIKKVHYDRKVTALLDNAVPSINSDL